MNKYFSLALKNIRRRKLRSWLTLLGIFIGIAAVVSLISLGNGLESAITGQFSSLGVDKLIITNSQTSFSVPGSTSIAKLTEHDVNIIKQVSGTEEVIPRLLRPVKIEYNKIASYTLAASMPQEDKQLKLIYDTLNLDASSGRLLRKDDFGKVVLGSDFAKTTAYDKQLQVGARIKTQAKEFEIIGFMKPASTVQLNIVVLMLEDDMKKLFDVDNEWDMIIVKVDDNYNVDKVAEDIKEKLRKDRHEKEGEEDFSVQTPASLIGSVNTILNIINLIIIGIASVSLIVGGIGIANTMYTSVLERTREIGVMKAVGARNSDVLIIFLFESGLLGLIGGVIGAILGISLSLGISSIANAALGTTLLKVSISWPLLLGAISFSLVVGILSGILPAIQASKLKPVDALRS
jgi:putative ABC transport system permease protein